MVDVSDQWSEPVEQADGSWLSRVDVPTEVTLANPGDQMRFTFTLVTLRALNFGGTCTVTAT